MNNKLDVENLKIKDIINFINNFENEKNNYEDKVKKTLSEEEVIEDILKKFENLSFKGKEKLVEKIYEIEFNNLLKKLENLWQV